MTDTPAPTTPESINDALNAMTDWIGLVEQPAYGENSIYDEVIHTFVPRIKRAIEAEVRATPAAALDVERLARAIYATDLVNPVTFSVNTVDSEAERIAAEYARLSRTEEEAER